MKLRDLRYSQSAACYLKGKFRLVRPVRVHLDLRLQRSGHLFAIATIKLDFYPLPYRAHGNRTPTIGRDFGVILNFSERAPPAFNLNLDMQVHAI